MNLPEVDKSEVVQLFVGAAQISGRSIDDPMLAAEAAKLAAVVEQSGLAEFVALMRNEAGPDEGADQHKLRRYQGRVLRVARGRQTSDRPTSGKAEVVVATLNRETGEWEEDKAMWTGFLDNSIARACAARAKALEGHLAVVYRHNEPAPAGYKITGNDGKPVAVTSFRRIIWIEPVDQAGVQAIADYEAKRQAKPAPAESNGHAEPTTAPPRTAAAPPAERRQAPVEAPPEPTYDATVLLDQMAGEHPAKYDRACQLLAEWGVEDVKRTPERAWNDLRAWNDKMAAEGATFAPKAAAADSSGGPLADVVAALGGVDPEAVISDLPNGDDIHAAYREVWNGLRSEGQSALRRISKASQENKKLVQSVLRPVRVMELRTLNEWIVEATRETAGAAA